jgi:UDP-N-acetylglucosamine--N-acetylmuramyl-(pentapeptide) pyrophosphoryl-undecaprenol N-acetylglucosamine transferase
MAAPRPTPHAPRTPRTPLRVLFAAGGTGGHVYPALAIADALRALRPDAEVTFAGTAGRLEAEAVPKAGYPFRAVTAVALPRSLSKEALRVPLLIGQGLWDARALVRQVRPHVAVGTGGYVTGPVLLAARVAGVPVVLQEQNAFAGVTNRLLGRIAAEVHVAFEEALAPFPAGKAVLSGNPVRTTLTGPSRAEGRAFFGVPEGVPLLVITGGSLGAQRLNEAVLAHLPAMLGAEGHAVWITGPRYLARTQLGLSALGDVADRVRLVSYCDRMPLAYAAADLFLCRSGAITLAELALTGTPAVLVPSPNVAEDHQAHNARAMARPRAAVLLPESDLDAALAPTVHDLLHDPDRRARMAEAARTLARPDAADTIARRVIEIARG